MLGRYGARLGAALGKALDIKDPKLWEGVPPDEIWVMYRAYLRGMVDTVFRPDRPRAVVVVRPEPDAPVAKA